MKIGILTMPLEKNYGGIIQNYALQQVLKKGNNDVITINRVYRRNFILILLSQIKNQTYNRIKNIQWKKFTDAQNDIIFNKNRQFIKENIAITEKIKNAIALKSYINNNRFDAIIVGSDQVWRSKYTPNIEEYFLSFIRKGSKTKKLSYGASFGTDEWEYSITNTKKCKRLVNQFDAVSVREKSAVDLCRQYFDISADLVLDPTLLLSKEDYFKLFEKETNKSIGVFRYILDESEERNKIVDLISETTGLPVFTSQPKKSLSATELSTEISDYIFPSMGLWLKSFYDADFVVTDSFHGTVFSIIFEKPFVSIANKARGASRFISLLSQLDLEDRLIYNNSELDIKKLIDESIDYNQVGAKLKTLKEISIAFLNAKI